MISNNISYILNWLSNQIYLENTSKFIASPKSNLSQIDFQIQCISN